MRPRIVNDCPQVSNLSVPVPACLTAIPLLHQHRLQGLSRRESAEAQGVAESTLRHHDLTYHSRDLSVPLTDLLASIEGPAWLVRLLLSAFVHLVMLGGASSRSFAHFLVDAGLSDLFSTSESAIDRWRATLERGCRTFALEQHQQWGSRLAGRWLAVALDENFHEGPVFVGIEPRSGYILIEEAREAVTAEDWQQVMTKALEGLDVKVKINVHDQGSALVAYTSQCVGVLHSPDLMHLQRNAYTCSFRILGRRRKHVLDSIEKVAKKCKKQKDGRRRRPLEAHLQALNTELCKLDEDLVKLREAIKGIGLDVHLCDLESGRMQKPADLEAKLELRYATTLTIFEEWHLSDKCFKGLEIFRRDSIPTLVETLRATQGLIDTLLEELSEVERQLCRTLLIPAAYLHLCAKRTRDKDRRGVLDGKSADLQEHILKSLRMNPETCPNL